MQWLYPRVASGYCFFNVCEGLLKDTLARLDDMCLIHKAVLESVCTQTNVCVDVCITMCLVNGYVLISKHKASLMSWCVLVEGFVCKGCQCAM